MARFLSQEKEVPLSISSLIQVANAATINIISKTLIDLFYIILSLFFFSFSCVFAKLSPPLRVLCFGGWWSFLVHFRVIVQVLICGQQKLILGLLGRKMSLTEGSKLAHRIDWKAGGYARKISRNQSSRPQRLQPGLSHRPSLVRMLLLALGSELLCELLNCCVSFSFFSPWHVCSHGLCTVTLPDPKLWAGTFDCPNWDL